MVSYERVQQQPCNSIQPCLDRASQSANLPIKCLSKRLGARARNGEIRPAHDDAIAALIAFDALCGFISVCWSRPPSVCSTCLISLSGYKHLGQKKMLYSSFIICLAIVQTST